MKLNHTTTVQRAMDEPHAHLATLARTIPVYNSVLPIVFVTVVAKDGHRTQTIRYGHTALIDAVTPHINHKNDTIYYTDTLINQQCHITSHTTIIHMLHQVNGTTLAHVFVHPASDSL
jgi:hypothetical protein